tara:strand:+ start:215 stop:550 length:336 start_codon:yes stop_codon:yes gene_type:complete
METVRSADKIEISPLGNRKHERSTVGGEILVRQSNSQLFPAALSDLSVSGFKMTSYTHLDEQKPVYIRLPGIQTLTATIQWTGFQEYGCAFAQDLHPAVLEHLLAKLREHE